MTRLAIDPVTRIEGHLRIEVEHSGGTVQDAWSTGTMFRGIEQILMNRDPRYAWVMTQRLCGVCTHCHALTSIRAVEAALGITIPTNARLIRNILSGAEFVHDHVIHFYHLHALDWVDVVSALKADPAATATLCQKNNPGWSKNSTAYFTDVRSRLQTFVDSGQLGPFAGGYWGHPAYLLAPEANLLLVAHYLEALDWQREMAKVHAVLGGKNPHLTTYAVGGMSVTFAPNAPTGVNSAAMATVASIVTAGQQFVDQVLVPDVMLLAKTYQGTWSTLGAGPGNLLAYGEFPEADGSSPKPYLPGGRVTGRNLAAVQVVDQTKIAETVAASWYSYTGGDSTMKHPSAGETKPTYTGPTPPYTSITSSKYSWLKAPRYDGAVYEVGPLARLGVAYASGVTDVRTAVDGFLSTTGLGKGALFSTIGRVAARALECQLIARRMSGWVSSLRSNLTGGNLTIASTTKWQPSTWPSTASGWGTSEAPRGGLGHWVTITNGKISSYQMVVPTTWNGSPRDGKGTRGPWEQALIGTPIADPARPVEVLRTVHSFDPCMSCAVHVHRPGAEGILLEAGRG
jgi:hydrogenase large subunit